MARPVATRIVATESEAVTLLRWPKAVATRSRSPWASRPPRSMQPQPRTYGVQDVLTGCPLMCVLQGEMRARVSWLLVLAVYLALPSFQRERLEEMGFGEVLKMDSMRADAPLTQALRSRWDAEAIAFVFPWGHMITDLEDVSRITGLRVFGLPVSGYTYPCYRDLSHRLLGLTVGQRSSLVPRVDLQESLGLVQTGREVGKMADELLDRLVRGCWETLAREPGAQADLDLRRFLTFFLGRLLFATRGDEVHCRFLSLLEDLDQVGEYSWGAALLAHQFDSLGSSDWQTSISGFFSFLQVWTYLHLPGLGRGIMERSGLVPLARYVFLVVQVVWQPYLEEGDEGQPWLEQARPYFGHLASVRVLWSSLAEAGPLGLAGAFGDSMTRLIGASGPVSRLRTGSTGGDGFGPMRSGRDRADRLALGSAALCRAGSGRGEERGRAAIDEDEDDIGRCIFVSGSGKDLPVGSRRPTGMSFEEVRGGRGDAGGKGKYDMDLADTAATLASQWRLQAETSTAEVARLRTQMEAAVSQVGELTLHMQGSSRSGVSGAFVRQFLAGSSSRRRNKEEERCRAGEVQVKCRFGPEMKQDLLQFSWSWRPGVVVDLLASRGVDANLRILQVIGSPKSRFYTWFSFSLAPASRPCIPKAYNRY
ncbi:hypothetical protein Taro_028807 [Colocasia esculenta]|uniref:Aminotransferase-like plant mobile domain-containing protein n=1 Tax=Colocasia esculenta TaxID=4460 RepID=A0A843VRF0_COLES|nr:hypothetical protein [Colocasia esculenta]